MLADLDQNTVFPSLDGGARVWTWIANRRMSEHEKNAVEEALADFRRSWTSHGREVKAESAVYAHQILVLAADIPDGEISGCGIDKSVHALESAARKWGFDWTSALDVPLLDTDGELVVTSRSAVRHSIADGSIGPEAMVIDRAVTRLAEVRSGALVRPIRDTWLSRYLPPISTVRR